MKKRPRSTLGSSTDNSFLYTDTFSVRTDKQTLNIPVILNVNGKKIVDEALLDTGANQTWINKNMVRNLKLDPKPLRQRIHLKNVDGHPNVDPWVTHYVELKLKVGSQNQRERCLIANLGNHGIILGLQ